MIFPRVWDSLCPDIKLVPLLARPVTSEKIEQVRNETGGRAFLFLHRTELRDDDRHRKSSGVRSAEAPLREPFGTDVVLLDLYGNKWHFVQPVGN